MSDLDACLDARKAEGRLGEEHVSDPQPVDTGRDYVLNTNTGKFHYPSCRDVPNIKPYNRWDVHMTRDEVIGMGYVPCKHCYP